MLAAAAAPVYIKSGMLMPVKTLIVPPQGILVDDGVVTGDWTFYGILWTFGGCTLYINGEPVGKATQTVSLSSDAGTPDHYVLSCPLPFPPRS
jgi:hypothetical protein